MIKALLWKDARLNRAVFGVMVGMLLAPYLLSMVFAANESFAASMPIHRSWANLLLGANHFCLMFWPVAAALLGGNTFACERSDRASEFLAYLPPSRAVVAASKFAVAAAAGATFWATNLLLFLLASSSIGDNSFQYIDLSSLAPKWFFATIGLLTFGVAWLISAAAANTGPAVAAGLGAPVILFLVFQAITWTIGWPTGDDFGKWYAAACASLGMAALVGGWHYYLRRVVP